MDQKYEAIGAVLLTQHKLMHLTAQFPDEIKLLTKQLLAQFQTTFKELQCFL
jgi:hypothetical protein